MNKNSVLIVTMVPLRKAGTAVLIDDQTFEGIRHWCDSYNKVTYCGLYYPSVHDNQASASWRSLEPLEHEGKLKVVPLPIGFRPSEHFRHLHEVRALLRSLISDHEFLLFSIGAVFGDWGAIASREAARQGRKFAVWFDRVEHLVLKGVLPSMPLKRRLFTKALLPVMKQYHQHILAKAHAGVFQGKDCFDHYSSIARRAELVYDTHTKRVDLITTDEVERKCANILSGAPLTLTYVGRADPMKGPEDWLAVLRRLRQAGMPFLATWYGNGPSLKFMERQVEQAGLTDAVTLAGFVSDRKRVLSAIRQSDVFLFCHKTPESPRCLIEALVSGTPLVGYESAYVAGLLEGFGGGVTVRRNDVECLAASVQALNSDRSRLVELVRAAAVSGRRFDEEAIYARRTAMLRRVLATPVEPADSAPSAV